MRMAFAETVEADQFERILRLGAALALGDAAQGQRELDILFRGQPGKQAGLLEHDADPVRIGFWDRRAADGDGAGGLLA
jgi:hypothetical protein